MTKDQIITKLFTGKNFNDCISKMDPPHLRDELKMEVIAIVCEWPEEKIRGLYDRKELDFFVVRVILNQIQSDSSPFFRKFRKPTGDVVYDEYRRENFYTALDHYERMPNWREHENHAIAAPSFLDEEDAISQRMENEEREDKALQEVDELYWYNAQLLRAYVEHGSYRGIERATGIPHVSCFHSIKKSIEQIQQKVL